MSANLLFPWISLSVSAPLLGAALAFVTQEADRARRWAVGALTISLLALLAALAETARVPGAQLTEPFWPAGFAASWLVMDALNAVALPLFAALALGVTVLAPRRKVTPHWLAGVLLLTSATLAAYAANNLILLALAWAGSSAPFLVGRFFQVRGESELPGLAKGTLTASLVCLAIGILLLLAGSADSPLVVRLNLASPHAGQAGVLRAAFVFLFLAVVLRKGLFPAHSWVLAAFERGPLLPLTLLVNGHLGAFLLARIDLLLPDVAHLALPLLGDLGLVTAAYTALLALVVRQPRRLLGLLSISQASFVLVGLESNNAAGIAGGLVHLQVVTVATTMLAMVYTGLEARLGVLLDGRRFYGLAANAPRLAVFFIVGGLALVGLPLTLGFCAEDLLLHGTLETHPQLGYVLPLVTALNAFHILRLFAVLFLGRPEAEARGLVDALPRERWVLTAALLFLVLGGLAPAPLVRLPAAAAERLSAVIMGEPQTARLR